ncbi:MAG: glutamyl-tRNA reductase [Bacillota bacterium]
MLLIGLNHRTAPVEIREQLAFSRDGVATALMLFRSQFPGSEAAILSTCNRVEILVSSENGEATVARVMTFLSQVRDVPVTAFKPHLYYLEGRQVIRHLFRVIGGLDSMVVGEYQIVNQLKQAYAIAHEQGTTGPVLHRLFHHAFGVSKRIRTETAIGDGKVSIPSVAVEIIQKAVTDFAEKRILIVGAGEMAQLTAQYLRDANARQFAVTTRTLTNAKALADVCHGQAVPFHELDAQLVQADIVVTATACPAAILTVERVRAAQKRRAGRALFLIDLAVPRNIEAEVGAIAGVQLYDVDALGRIVEETYRQRAGQMQIGEQIIEEEVGAFEQWIAESKVRPLIEQMYQDVRALAEIEVRAMFRKCPELNEEQKQAVQQLVDRVVGKLMHPCVSAVRQTSMTESAATLAAAFRATRMGFAERNGVCKS